jgi:hypothetical protein
VFVQQPRFGIVWREGFVEGLSGPLVGVQGIAGDGGLGRPQQQPTDHEHEGHRRRAQGQKPAPSGGWAGKPLFVGSHDARFNGAGGGERRQAARLLHKAQQWGEVGGLLFSFCKAQAA